MLVGGAVFVAALLSSLAPPPPSFALQNSAAREGRSGAGGADGAACTATRCRCSSRRTRPPRPDSFALRITKGGQPVRGATVTLAFNHLEMQMPQQEYQLREISPGVYSRSAPALVMVGQWGLVVPDHAARAAPRSPRCIVDQANG